MRSAVFERTMVESNAYAFATGLANRLFDRTPEGIRVIRAMGGEAVVATGYNDGDGVGRAYSVMRHPLGLRVMLHRIIDSDEGGLNCAASSCVSIDHMAGSTTEICTYDGSEADMVTRLRLQTGVCVVLSKIIGSGAFPEHNPLIEGAAADEFEMLSRCHAQDELLTHAYEEIT